MAAPDTPEVASPRFNASGATSAKLFITELPGNRVFRYDVTQGGGATFDLAITAGSAPQGIAFNAAGEMFVVNRDGPGSGPGPGSISRFLDPRGNPSPSGTIPGPDFNLPHWAATFWMGELYTAQRGGRNVLRFAFDGSGNVTGSDIPIVGLGGDGARGVQVDPANGDVLVSLCCGRNPSINRYELDASGNATLVQQFFAPGDPHDMVFSPWGELFTANINGGTVSRFTIDALGDWVPNGQITGFGKPTGLDFSPWGELFVSNRATGEVYRFIFSATTPTDPEIPSGSFTVTPLSTPGSLAEIQFASGGDAGPLSVAIDIKPGSNPNCFNNDGAGILPVAILGSASFDVTQVDPETVELEGMEVAARGRSGKLMAHVEDVNGDGIDDLVAQIEDVDGTFTSGSTMATLTGKLFDGTLFEGTDDICIVPSNNS
jgi:hypothetical protein